MQDIPSDDGEDSDFVDASPTLTNADAGATGAVQLVPAASASFVTEPSKPYVPDPYFYFGPTDDGDSVTSRTSSSDILPRQIFNAFLTTESPAAPLEVTLLPGFNEMLEDPAALPTAPGVAAVVRVSSRSNRHRSDSDAATPLPPVHAAPSVVVQPVGQAEGGTDFDAIFAQFVAKEQRIA